MTNAQKIPAELLYTPTDPAYDEAPRKYQGCPTLAVTKGGRIWMGWYAGGVREPDMDNYNLLLKSDDGGETWSDPYLVIPSSKEHHFHALDIQLWTSPEGKLYVYWVQNDTIPDDGRAMKAEKGQPLVRYDGWIFPDFAHNEWVSICEDPDADAPVFSAPRRVDVGFLRCKPLVTATGRWINFNYDQTPGKGLDRYGYSISDDRGETWTHRYGAEKLATYFDESMAYQKKDGTIRMFARSSIGELAESISDDNGETWSEARPSGITHADTRFFVSRTPSGRILLICNDDARVRKNITLCLSEDDGETWPYKKCIDTRAGISYPDADFRNGEICLTYDRERTGAREILFLRCSEEDILDPDVQLEAKIVSKPDMES